MTSIVDEALLRERERVMPGTSDFVLVCRRRRHCDGRKILNKGAKIAQIHENCKVNYKHLLSKLDDTLVWVRYAPFTKLVLSHLTESLTVLNSNGISEIVCYGLGQFSRSRSSRCQLALLLCLKERYNARVYAYDPMFCSEEVQALRAFGLEIIETNEEGKRVVRDETTTLVYMPHCCRQLTNNFLYANWGSGLSNCILFANSFSKIIDNCLLRDILETASYMLRIEPYVTEIRLKNSFIHDEVFNDLSIHIFTKKVLLQIPSHFWSLREEPRYSDESEFITAAT